MTLSTAFNVALSGLSAAGRASGLVSENIANAMTPGYTRRTLELVTNPVGGGVRVDGAVRQSDPVLTADRRSADAAFGFSNEIAAFFDRFARATGGPDDAGSLVNRMADLESALIAAGSNPGAATRLDSVVLAARNLGNSISAAAEALRVLRSDADRNIGQQVESLNTSLTDVADLNTQIQSLRLAGRDASPLIDQRDRLIDTVNTIIPVRIAQRDNETVALYSAGGAILLDGRPASLGFTPATDTNPFMTIENGLLSGLEIDGQPVRTFGESAAIRGGTLAAQFEIRDRISIEAQADLDILARDLVERFQDPALDPTTPPGDPGLFTDGGLPLAAANAQGLANRLSLNVLVDPDQGGESWRLRAGLGAASPGEPGDATLLNALGEALTAARPLATATLGPGDFTAAGLASTVLSRTEQSRSEAEQRVSLTAASLGELQRLELETGVDTDAELQSLMRVEQAYAANARVLETIDELMTILLRL